MSLNCQTKDAFSKSQAGGWRYDIIGLGMKINMADVNAAIGLAQIREYSKLLNDRKRIFERYDKAFSECKWAITSPSHADNKNSFYHVYALRLKGVDEANRDQIITEISRHEVSVNVLFIPMPMLTYFFALGYEIQDYPQAYKNFSGEIVSFPFFGRV